MPAAVFIALRKTKKAGGLANLQIFSNFVHTNMEPAELISAIRAGSREAFDEMCGRYYAPLTAYARLFLNGNWAQDVVQDVFVNVWVRREALDPGQSLYGYLLRSVYNQHLEARLYASLRKFVEPPDRIPAQRAHDHGSDEHRDIAADDDAHGGNGPDYPAAFAGDVAPGRIGDQQRQQVGQHRVDQACHLGVGPPSRGDEERRDESPRDERADVGHDHAAQGPAEFLYLLSHSFLSCI